MVVELASCSDKNYIVRRTIFESFAKTRNGEVCRVKITDCVCLGKAYVCDFNEQKIMVNDS